MKAHTCASSADYVEMSLNQLVGIMEMTMKFVDSHGFSTDEIRAMRARIYNPKSNNDVDVDFFIPSNR